MNFKDSIISGKSGPYYRYLSGGIEGYLDRQKDKPEFESPFFNNTNINITNIETEVNKTSEIKFNLDLYTTLKTPKTNLTFLTVAR